MFPSLCVINELPDFHSRSYRWLILFCQDGPRGIHPLLRAAHASDPRSLPPAFKCWTEDYTVFRICRSSEGASVWFRSAVWFSKAYLFHISGSNSDFCLHVWDLLIPLKMFKFISHAERHTPRISGAFQCLTKPSVVSAESPPRPPPSPPPRASESYAWCLVETLAAAQRKINTRDESIANVA
jgi:hypothetical protein